MMKLQGCLVSVFVLVLVAEVLIDPGHLFAEALKKFREEACGSQCMMAAADSEDAGKMIRPLTVLVETVNFCTATIQSAQVEAAFFLVVGHQSVEVADAPSMIQKQLYVMDIVMGAAAQSMGKNGLPTLRIN
eukprot:CAMPEP_0113941672 /NCGR_PEP_ID=MMETSP1339-20121228/7542_1 /TAXON_ID=94617 /ORGANISM="Fibrocapsa japonica" /LENGTH=131 /DNA_ID=CAMNT_0000945883 /DNA_START=9 /DNA_END=405 /DNA_ORIENTATION=- /assembly_acc=CAM_ASM_000762